MVSRQLTRQLGLLRGTACSRPPAPASQQRTSPRFAAIKSETNQGGDFFDPRLIQGMSLANHAHPFARSIFPRSGRCRPSTSVQRREHVRGTRGSRWGGDGGSLYSKQGGRPCGTLASAFFAEQLSPSKRRQFPRRPDPLVAAPHASCRAALGEDHRARAADGPLHPFLGRDTRICCWCRCGCVSPALPLTCCPASHAAIGGKLFCSLPRATPPLCRSPATTVTSAVLGVAAPAGCAVRPHSPRVRVRRVGHPPPHLLPAPTAAT